MGRHLQTLAAELPGSWVRQASCGGRSELEPLFFPERTAAGSRGMQTALAMCRSCPVQVECLRFALDTDQPDGVWGGTSAHERARMRRRRAA